MALEFRQLIMYKGKRSVGIAIVMVEFRAFRVLKKNDGALLDAAWNWIGGLEPAGFCCVFSDELIFAR